MLLKNQVAIVTGASRGIGKSIAEKLAIEGASVILSSKSKRCEELAIEMSQKGSKAWAFPSDISNETEVKTLVEFAEKEVGKIDILVNNAGVVRDQLLMRLSEADWEFVLNTNLKGAFFCSREVIRSMIRQRKGKILNIASVVGLVGNRGQSAYSASKAGLIALTKTLALELSTRNVCVNAIAPGFIDTDMTHSVPDELKKKILSNIPLGRFGKPEEVAELACFLSSEKSNYITGQVFVIDGGMTMTG